MVSFLELYVEISGDWVEICVRTSVETVQAVRTNDSLLETLHVAVFILQEKSCEK